ncbi:M23 family metallopeptidase [Erythrobacter sp. EC-HK427]|uniref:M23 family metallopeptidase n=2 Tax=Erythrobacter sp. EC-HK427 TaxID=2038396 RepID=UPI00125128E8|nr:M23 family metallopeptidase [Erythrobacter sp. EC-HK427]VVT02519.1 conserved exported hypothetical protein [Erythrobacter sp. EC-HK427]
MLVKITGILAAGAVMLSSPALANDPVVSADPTVLADGVLDLTAIDEAGPDEEFSELFASWEALEDGGVVSTTGDVIPPAPVFAAVSVPQIMPLSDARLTSGYGMRDHPILQRRARHNGVDLAAPRGTPVYATADGLVEMAQYYSSYGNYVQIEHGGDIETRYAHLSSYTVAPGQHVRMGQLIGYVGSTGRSTGPHLHYEVRVSGTPVNPIPYMTANLEFDYGAAAARGGPEE